MGTAGSQRAIDAVRHLGATTVEATRAINRFAIEWATRNPRWFTKQSRRMTT